MLLYKKKKKKNESSKGTRFLISVRVHGSAGPIRFVVNEKELVSAVIETTLRSYAREGRLPILGSDIEGFVLYCHNNIAQTEALSPWQTIGSAGSWNFMLCKNPINSENSDAALMSGKRGGNRRSWLHKSLNIRVSTH